MYYLFIHPLKLCRKKHTRFFNSLSRKERKRKFRSSTNRYDLMSELSKNHISEAWVRNNLVADIGHIQDKPCWIFFSFLCQISNVKRYPFWAQYYIIHIVLLMKTYLAWRRLLRINYAVHYSATNWKLSLGYVHQ